MADMDGILKIEVDSSQLDEAKEKLAHIKAELKEVQLILNNLNLFNEKCRPSQNKSPSM